MKKLVWIGLLVVCSVSATAQWSEAMQLALNIQKLNQLRQILQNMYNGYKILTDGYNKVKNITEGNYKLHEVFLDGLMAVNPKIKDYKKVADIVTYQQQIVKEYKHAYQRFRDSKMFTVEELEYMSKVYGNLVARSIHNLDKLLLVITASKLRMSDAERLSVIDDIYEHILNQVSFLRSFNQQTSILGLQRAKESNDIQTMQMIYGLGK